MPATVGDRPASGSRWRQVFVKLHRYAGLALALFLTLAGLTGSVLAFNDELDAWLNPELYDAKHAGESLPPSEIAAHVRALDPRIVPVWIPLSTEPRTASVVWVSTKHDPETGEHYELGFNQVFVEPSTGEILGTRDWGAFSLTRENLIPFLYVLHYSLHLDGELGLWIMGIAAMVWIFDCFVGAYLTLPRGRPFLVKWRPAWLIKVRSDSAHRIVFDLHRAAGLWFWGVLLLIAISAVYMNLPENVFRPVVGSLLELTPPPDEGRPHREGDVAPVISFEAAVARADEEAKRIGLAAEPAIVGWDHDHGLYYVIYNMSQFRAPPGLGASTLYIADEDGRLAGQEIAGQGTAGDIFLQFQFPFHSGEIAGLPGRIAICIIGILVAILSITGVIVWARKGRSRRYRSRPR